MRSRIQIRRKSGKRNRQPPRTIVFSNVDVWPPVCPWCRITTLTVLADVIHEGPTTDLVETVCRCDTCDLGAVVRHEVAHGELDYHYQMRNGVYGG